jgi:hypothetical protein
VAKHVSFESAQVTSVTRAAVVGKTKEIRRFRRLVEPNPPPNFRWVYSYGGVEDGELDPTVDRVADVFPDEAAITTAGWASQEASDLLAVLGPRLVGVPANRIPHFLKKQGDHTFRSWQTEVNAERAARRQRRRTQPAAVPGCQPPSRNRPASDNDA